LVTEKEIKAFAPHADQRVVNAIVENWDVAEEAGINTPKRIRQFFANIAAETDLNALTEGMSYRSAKNIVATWSKRFKEEADAEPYVRQPELLAEKVYGRRNGNREGTDDAYRYRGRGLLQTTGYDNYKKQTENLGRIIGADFLKNPEMLADPRIAFLSAVAEWERRGCNELADEGNTRGIRIAINGGTNGLGKVEKYLAQANKVWPDGPMQEKVSVSRGRQMPVIPTSLDASVNDHSIPLKKVPIPGQKPFLLPQDGPVPVQKPFIQKAAVPSGTVAVASLTIDLRQFQKQMGIAFKKNPQQALEDYPGNESVLAANAVLDGLKEKGGRFRASVPQMRGYLANRIERGQRIPTPQEAMKMVHNTLLDRGS